MKQRVVGHMLVKNEERFVWYAINSVLPFVDKLIIFDTGSEDRTVDIINTISSPKIVFREVGGVTDKSHTEYRNEMIAMSGPGKYDWIMIVDGDEIWSYKQLEKCLEALESTKANTVVVRTINVVGDIYHKLPSDAGQYQILGHKGHLAMRFLRTNIKGLKVVNPHGGQSYLIDGLPVLEQSKEKIAILPYSYIHTTHLRRSRLDKKTLKRSFKYKYELGEDVSPKSLPEIFFADRPLTVPDVMGKMNMVTYALCAIFTVPRRLRRRFFRLKSGYI